MMSERQAQLDFEPRRASDNERLMLGLVHDVHARLPLTGTTGRKGPLAAESG